MSVTVTPSSWAGAPLLSNFDYANFILTNNGASPVIVNSYTLGGSNSANFLISGITFPCLIPSGGSVEGLLMFIAKDANAYSASVVFNCSDGSSPLVNLTGQATNNWWSANDDVLLFWPIMTNFASWVPGDGTITVAMSCTNIGPGNASITAFGVDPLGIITLTGLPTFPYTFNSGASFNFTLNWTLPSSVVDGLFYLDNLMLEWSVTNTSGGANRTGSLGGVGFFLPLAPYKPIVGIAPLTLVGLSGGAGGNGQLGQFNPLNLNCESPAALLRTYDFGIPTYEKKTLRWAVRYENLGVASLSILITSPRGNPQTQTISIGDSTADGSIRTAYFDIEYADELPQVTISTAGSSGPISIVDMYPKYEPAGEYVENT